MTWLTLGVRIRRQCEVHLKAIIPVDCNSIEHLLTGFYTGGGEGGLTKNLFKIQPRLSNPPPHPNKASGDDDIYLIMTTLMGSTDPLCRIFFLCLINDAPSSGKP